ncbi:hypothetical protein Niako_4076 [Niastella koreensis GR20-10]|uniref:Uncharacterized protein n=1 Tax=Niastella koreensis (strain DSM 17620 / KACC 11465 / NBRC 106392 / GR20-10) TaxID=700598 RepID=G8TC48_NIAKG|nr:DUF6223 family protein [Niastella koreensis]AEW00355.1 hypothetical protein Niako_4076 [Niastella koreensis GR20-10]
MSIVITLVGLIGVIMGRQALVRTNRRIGSARPKAIAALLLGLTGIVASGLHLAISSGGFGTGSGRAGAIVAMVLGFIGAAFGWLALARSKQTAGHGSLR